VIKKEEFTN